MQWPPQPAPSKEGGLWIEVVAPKTNPSTSSEPFSPVRIDSKDQVQVIEAMGSGGIGSAQWGEINRSTKGKTITTLVGFIMPETDYSTRTCNLYFTKEYASSGTKTFKLYNFTPNGGAEIFESFLVSWQDKRGKRGSQLSTYKLGENKPVWTFKCPKPGKGVDFEFVPTEEKVNIKWNSVQGKGGPWVEVV
ncbi:hypothetical protein BDD12DRAFT_849694 [Trichophaea hybrida]|nr:hypothetical protein BDD12DRAFT_849694 [Trichophaea hybrida]